MFGGGESLENNEPGRSHSPNRRHSNAQGFSQALNNSCGAWSTPGSIPLLSLCPKYVLGIIDLLEPQGQSQTQVNIPELSSLRRESAVQEGCSSSKVGPTSCLVLRKPHKITCEASGVLFDILR